jgi:hypothetical protein
MENFVFERKIKFLEICFCIYKRILKKKCSKSFSHSQVHMSAQVTVIIISQLQNFIKKDIVARMGRRFSLLFARGSS